MGRDVELAYAQGVRSLEHGLRQGRDGGLPNVKLYAGSMVDWTQQPGAPALENQPSRAESLAYDARQWWQRKFK